MSHAIAKSGELRVDKRRINAALHRHAAAQQTRDHTRLRVTRIGKRPLPLTLQQEMFENVFIGSNIATQRTVEILIEHACPPQARDERVEVGRCGLTQPGERVTPLHR